MAYRDWRYFTEAARWADQTENHPEWVAAINAYFAVVDDPDGHKGRLELCVPVAVSDALADCENTLTIGYRDGFTTLKSARTFWIYERSEDCVVLIGSLHWAGTSTNAVTMLRLIDGVWKVAHTEPRDPHSYTDRDQHLAFTCDDFQPL